MTSTPRTLIGTRTFMQRFDFKDISEVQRRAKAGLIPGAVKVNGRWKFDPDTYYAAVTGSTSTQRRVTAKAGRR